jgi:hypothetical protein
MDDSPLDEVVSLAIVFSLIGSLWVPLLRTVSGLLCLGLAVALVLLIGRSVLIDEHIRLARAIPMTAVVVLIGVLEFRWGQRTVAPAG